MRLSINLASAMPRYDVEGAIALYKNAGFDAMDFSLCDIIYEESAFYKDGWRSEAQRVRAISDRIGLPVNQTHTPFRFTRAQFENNWDFVYEQTVKSLEISAILGASIAVVHPIHYMTYHGYEEEIFERNMAFYKSLIPYCRDYGIKIGVENMWQRDARRGCIIADTCSRSQEFIRYIDTLDSEYLVACLDVGHVGLPLTDEEAEDVIRALGHDRLKALHVHDNNYKDDQHLLPFMGKMNWSEITKALGQIDYTGDFTYEVKGTFVDIADAAFAPVGAEFMAKIGKHLCSLVEQNRVKQN